MRVRSALGARARGLRCGAATAGKGFGVDAEAMEMDEEDDDGMEEIDFDYAAEVVRETWELFAETGPEEQVCREDGELGVCERRARKGHKARTACTHVPVTTVTRGLGGGACSWLWASSSSLC
jgi:hypothetical protein